MLGLHQQPLPSASRPARVGSSTSSWSRPRAARSCVDATSSTTPQASPLDKALVDRLDAGFAGSTDASQAEVLALVKSLKEAGTLRHFDMGPQVGVPKRIYTIEELRLNKIEAPLLLSPTDKSLNSVRSGLQVAAAAGLSALAIGSNFDANRVLYTGFALLFAVVLDQVANGGGGQGLLVDTLGRIINPSYRQRVAYHEAGHMLVAYLVGICPRAYTLSSWDAFSKYRALNVQAGTQFCDSAFQAEVNSGRLSSSSLDRYTSVALGGVVAEYLRFEQAEGGMGDIAQLDNLLRALGFSQTKADAEVRWAVLNVAAILKRHPALHEKLADAMDRGESTASCIALIEQQLALEGAYS